MSSKPFRLLDLSYPAAQRVMDLMTPAELIMMSTSGKKLANFTQFYIRKNKKKITLEISEGDEFVSIEFNELRMNWMFFTKIEDKVEKTGDERRTFKFGEVEIETGFDVNGSLISYMGENLCSVIQIFQWLQSTLGFKNHSVNVIVVQNRNWWAQLFISPQLLIETEDLNFFVSSVIPEFDQSILHVVKMRADAGKTSMFNEQTFNDPFFRVTDVLSLRGETCAIGYNFLTVQEMYEIVTFFLYTTPIYSDFLVMYTAHWYPQQYQELKDLLNLVPFNEHDLMQYCPGHDDIRATDEILWAESADRRTREKAVQLRMNSYDAGYVHIFLLLKRKFDENGVEIRGDEEQDVEDDNEE